MRFEQDILDRIEKEKQEELLKMEDSVYEDSLFEGKSNKSNKPRYDSVKPKKPKVKYEGYTPKNIPYNFKTG